MAPRGPAVAGRLAAPVVGVTAAQVGADRPHATGLATGARVAAADPLGLLVLAKAVGVRSAHGVSVIYGNRTWNDVIYRHALDDLQDQYPDKLEIIHALSREPRADQHGPNVVASRVTRDLVAKHIPDPTAIEVFACGPALSSVEKRRAKKSGEQLRPRFMESVVEALNDVGMEKKRVHKESYG